jgi:hypothetical protein
VQSAPREKEFHIVNDTGKAMLLYGVYLCTVGNLKICREECWLLRYKQITEEEVCVDLMNAK